MAKILDRLFPSRVCKREGHKMVGWQSMGPHLNNPEKGTDGGVYYGLRYVVRCKVCGEYAKKEGADG